LVIEPRALEIFSSGRQTVLVSGTNGKTTTTKFLARGLAAAAATEVLTNAEGANLPSGLATALAGGRQGVPAVLEVDEAWLGPASAAVKPAVLVLLNLSRDQLDRNNEVRQVALRWRQACEALRPGATAVANADDPLVAWAASAAPRASWVSAGLGWTADATGCPRCSGPVVFFAGGDFEGGDWKCEACGFARPRPDIWLERGEDGRHVVMTPRGPCELRLRLPGRANRANAAMALGALVSLGYDPQSALAALAEVGEVGGRYKTVQVEGGLSARLFLAKNPAGWAEIFDMLSPAPAPVVVVINARTADGHDPSWLWDVPFERLAGRCVVATGERYLDLAVRLHYAGLGPKVVPGLPEALREAGKAAGAVDVVANYTAFHQLLRVLGR
jgi:UDP-N-acetylmuramyl tripeptide synthase